jgi:hypothetical protein
LTTFNPHTAVLSRTPLDHSARLGIRPRGNEKSYTALARRRGGSVGAPKGKPEAAAAQTEAAAGKPEAAAGKPEAAAGKPEAAAGKPEAAAGKPEAAAQQRSLDASILPV